MQQNEIESGMAKRLKAMPDAWALKIEDKDFTPKPGESYMEMSIIYGDVFNISKANGNFGRQTNILQVDLYYPAKLQSPKDLDVYAEKVRRWFFTDPTGTRITEGTTDMDIMKLPVIRKPGGSSSPHIRRVVDVTFDCEDVPYYVPY